MEENQKESQVKVEYREMVVDGREWKWNEEESNVEVSQNM